MGRISWAAAGAGRAARSNHARSAAVTATMARNCRVSSGDELNRHLPRRSPHFFDLVRRPVSRPSQPRLRFEEHAGVAANLQLAVFRPDLGLVDLAVGWIGDRAVLVALAARRETLDDH